MTGAFPANVEDALANVKGTSAPPRVDKTKDVAKDPAANEYEVEYTMQTGLTRYAPMQPIPATKITAKNTKPMHPTSKFDIAKTFLPIPSIATTLTQSQTFSVSSRENDVSFQSQLKTMFRTDVVLWEDSQANQTDTRLLPRPCPTTTWPSSSGGGRIRWYGFGHASLM
jgi:hypothetical protein